MPNLKLAIAPMMDYTDRHYRYFMRLITRHTLLYTEMVTTGAVLRGHRDHLLGYHPSEHPIALQLGGCDPLALAECAKIAEEYGYDEVNLNIGCPSNRVQSGRFGACLMAEPELVARCVSAMQSACNIPVTVKTRLGIDQQDTYDHLSHFIETVANAGCKTFIIHARKAWLKGLSPKENREIPPLNYAMVKKVKNDSPHLQIILNGGITDLKQASQHLSDLDGIMIGRAAYQNPFLFSIADKIIYNETDDSSDRFAILEKYFSYVEQALSEGVPLSRLIRPVLGLFYGVRGAHSWRRHISEHAYRQGAGIEILKNALQCVLMSEQ